MLKQFLLANICLFQIAHASQSIDSLLKIVPMQSIVLFNKNESVITINLAKRNLASLDGFQKISSHINKTYDRKHAAPSYTIAITLADNMLVSLENISFINFMHKSPILSFNVSGNMLKSLPKDFLSVAQAPFNKTLKNVFIDHNHINQLPKKFLKKTKSLEILNLSKNKGHPNLSKTFFDDKQYLVAFIAQGRYQTPPRRKHSDMPEDLALALSDSL